MTLIEKIRDLVAEGQTEKSIEELLGYVKDNNNEVIDQLILLKGRLKTLNKSIVEGTIDGDVAAIERAKINESILKILNEITPSYLGLDKPKPQVDQSIKPTNKSNNWVLILGGIIVGIALVIFYLSKKPNPKSTTQQGTVQETVFLEMPLAEHNLIQNNAYWMKMWVPGRIINSKGKNGQLKTYFTYNGQLLMPNAQEVTFRDPMFNCVTVFSQPFYIDSDDYTLDKHVMSIPYTSLNLYYTAGKTTYYLQFFVEVWINGTKVKISPHQNFTVKW